MKIVFFPALLGFILIEGAIGGPAAICDSTICARDPNSVLKDGPPTCAASAKGESPGCTFAECCESLCTPFNGLLNINAKGKGNVCCPDSCDACNYNVGCLQTGRPECCPWKIRKQMTADICGEGDPAEDAPCNLPAPPTPAPPTPAPPTPAPTPPPDCSPFDGFLVTADGGVPVCCPLDCNGKCNFNEGCTKGDSSFEECCPFKIRDRAEDCGVVPVAPCVPVPTTPAPPTPAPPTPAPPTPAPPTPTTPAQECFPGFPGVLDEHGKACCPLGMCQKGGVDTCGERGCGQLDGKAKNCCSTRILRDNNKCSNKSSAPCVA